MTTYDHPFTATDHNAISRNIPVMGKVEDGKIVYARAEDAKSAIRWLRMNARRLGIDVGRVIAGGGSSGGSIAAFAACEIFKALLLTFPVEIDVKRWVLIRPERRRADA